MMQLILFLKTLNNHMGYTKEEAINNAKLFLSEVKELEDKYAMSFNSDTGDIYLSYKSSEENKHWDNVNIGWVGDGTELKVLEKTEADKKAEALAKLSHEDRKVLGLE